MVHPEIAPTVSELRRKVQEWRSKGARVGLVPTMGALHEGHLSLVKQAAEACDHVVVSIFVNPAQFGPNEDFDRYPRTFESDTARLAATGAVDVVFAPSVSEMYPAGFATSLQVQGPANGLETDFRPHFFSGVATVVSKLLIAAMPDYTIFGEKDYQQLLVIRRMMVDLGLPIEIAGGPIIRESDGLAMSSRNAYLSPEQRQIAGRMNLILRDVGVRMKHGDPVNVTEEFGRSDLLEAGFDTVDYVAVRDAETLSTISDLSRPARVLAAAKIGATRLIDNMAV